MTLQGLASEEGILHIGFSISERKLWKLLLENTKYQSLILAQHSVMLWVRMWKGLRMKDDLISKAGMGHPVNLRGWLLFSGFQGQGSLQIKDHLCVYVAWSLIVSWVFVFYVWLIHKMFFFSFLFPFCRNYWAYYL